MKSKYSDSSRSSYLILTILLFSSMFESIRSENNRDSTLSLVHSTLRPLAPSKLLEEEDKDNSIYEDEEELGTNKFSYKFHEDDHSFYAGRSLMSTANIDKQHHHINHQQQQQHHSHSHDSQNEKSKATSDSRDHKSIEDSRRDKDEEYEALKKVDYAEKEWQLMFRAFDSFQDSISSSIVQQIGKQTDLFDDVVSRLQPECGRDIYHTRDSLKKQKLWALRMVDSNGKIPSGITYGRFSSPGDYEECLGVRVDESIYKPLEKETSLTNSQLEHYKFHGKYCLLDFRLPLPERPRDKLLSIHDPVIDLSNTELGKRFPELKNYSGYASVFYEVGYMHGLCIPSTCDIQDLAKSVGILLEGLHIIVNNTVDCEETFDEPQPLRTSQIISLAFLFLLFSNASIASFIHHLRSTRVFKRQARIYRQQDSKNLREQHSIKEKLNEIRRPTNTESLKINIKRWMIRNIQEAGFYTECFSVQTNLNRLTKPDPRGLTFVHYTRIVAMALTVITHTAGLGTLQAITKPTDTSNSEQIFRDFIPQMLANAFTSIQIFFFMAGFMLVISTYPSIKREKGHISFIEYVIKRAIRLMPGIAATICLNFLWPLIVGGPMLNYFIRLIVIPCEDNWWRTLTFLSNFDHVEKMCLRHSYFSASDYQLHVMAFPLLILLYKQPLLSLILAGILTVAGFVLQVIMILTKTVLPFMMIDYIDKEAFFNVVHYIHHPVWNHMSAFFYGFIIGYLVVKQIRINISDRFKKILWFTLIPSGLISIFAPYFWNHYKRPIYRWQMVLYVLFDRFILLTTCAWLSYATMVLGRKPVPKKVAPPNVNLPNIISLDQDKEKQQKESDQSVAQLTRVPSSLKVEQLNVGKQQVGGNIPRQRSSPNILADRESEENQPVSMRPAVSSMNVSDQNDSATSNQSNNSVQVNQSASPVGQTNVAKKLPQVQAKNRSLSNVNTLCLILSRLTFQLYLFNMVVLWVDVNNSKYYWFFSYYFIITKAAAVYICSSLIAMVFFITLESPSLTLYIMWVKSRAQTRANKSEKEFNVNKGTNDNRSRQLSTFVSQEQVQVCEASSESLKSQVGSGQVGGTFDGLCMRSSALSGSNNSKDDESSGRMPVFSFIDLSAPPISVQDCSITTNNNQTKI